MNSRKGMNGYPIQQIGGFFSILPWVLAFFYFIQTMAMAGGFKTNGTDLSTLTLSQAGKEFQKLRKVKGHFDGGPFNPEVDGWKGLKHQLMIHIAQKIKNISISESELTSILGPPDKRLAEEYHIAQYLKNMPGSRRFLQKKSIILIYQWRGNHDVLFVISQLDSIVGTAWWHAGE